MQITDRMIQQLDYLGLVNYQDVIKVVAVTENTELKKSDFLTMGQYDDCTYFIFKNQTLMKIGKVGGGVRCMSKRISDYRSSDPIGLKIKQAIQQGADVKILAINFNNQKENLYGVLTEGGVKGPKLEKALIEKANQMQVQLQWNNNKG